MNDPSSRHSSLSTYAVPLGPRGGLIDLYTPRVAAPSAPVLVHRVVAGDRLDLLAQRYFGDPHQYWRLVDASAVFSPEELLEPGTVLLVPGRP